MDYPNSKLPIIGQPNFKNNISLVNFDLVKVELKGVFWGQTYNKVNPKGKPINSVIPGLSSTYWVTIEILQPEKISINITL